MTTQRVLYECCICGCYHPFDWDGDCRDDENRYASPEEYAEQHEIRLDDIEIRSWEEVDGPSEPEEGDYTTEDHIHWHQYGKLVLTTADPHDRHTSADDWKEQLNAHMETAGFWPNAWWISDHGNAHLIDLSEGTEP